jgi:hypothetical protein
MSAMASDLPRHRRIELITTEQHPVMLWTAKKNEVLDIQYSSAHGEGSLDTFLKGSLGPSDNRHEI